MSSNLTAGRPVTFFESCMDEMTYKQLPLDILQSTFDLAKANAARHFYTDAIQHIDYAISEIQHSLTSFFPVYRATLYNRAGQHEKALEDGTRAIELSPNLPDGYMQTAAAFLSQGEHPKALHIYEKSLESVPKGHSIATPWLHGRTCCDRKSIKEPVAFCSDFLITSSTASFHFFL